MSTPPLFLCNPLPVADRFVLDGDEGRHAARVRRIKAGETVLVGDGSGALARCQVVTADAHGLVLDVTSRLVEARPRPRITVVQALPKGERADLAVELLTELGADEIVPWAAARSIGQWRERSLEKWRRTAAEAAKQSRRAWLPVVTDLATTAEVVRRAGGAFTLVLHEAATDPVPAVAPDAEEVLLVVGPEGGITGEELTGFTAAGATAVRLGRHVLRTSTAGAAGLAALSVRFGRWS